MTSTKKTAFLCSRLIFHPPFALARPPFAVRFHVSSPVIAQWRSKQKGEETYDGIVGNSIARLTRRHDNFPSYRVDTLMERKRSIQEISRQIQDDALPFFARFSDLSRLLDDVQREGFFRIGRGAMCQRGIGSSLNVSGNILPGSNAIRWKSGLKCSRWKEKSDDKGEILWRCSSTK